MGRPPVDGKTFEARTLVRMSKEHDRALKEYAAEVGTSAAGVLRMWMIERLRAAGKIK